MSLLLHKLFIFISGLMKFASLDSNPQWVVASIGQCANSTLYVQQTISPDLHPHYARIHCTYILSVYFDFTGVSMSEFVFSSYKFMPVKAAVVNNSCGQ
jgi:hypothetical protein